jgi:uncharacterized protein (DUF58 family)
MLDKTIALKWPGQKPGSVRTRLTGAGWGFAALVLCGFLMSVNFSNNLIFAMTFLLVGIALVGWYHTRVNVRGLALADWRAAPVFAGQNAVYGIPVSNRSGSGRHGLRAFSAGAADGGEIHLGPGEEAVLRLERPAPARGLLKPVSATVRSCFPLGIFEGRMATKDLPECLVYPKPVGDQPLPDRAPGSQAHLTAESGTYTDLRRYAPGDPLSRISWKAFARFDELYTKEFDGAQGQPALWLRWSEVRAAGVEQKLSQLCRWALDLHQQNREFALELPGIIIETGSEEEHLGRCLRALALFGETGKES